MKKIGVFFLVFILLAVGLSFAIGQDNSYGSQPGPLQVVANSVDTSPTNSMIENTRMAIGASCVNSTLMQEKVNLDSKLKYAIYSNSTNDINTLKIQVITISKLIFQNQQDCVNSSSLGNIQSSTNSSYVQMNPQKSICDIVKNYNEQLTNLTSLLNDSDKMESKNITFDSLKKEITMIETAINAYSPRCINNSNQSSDTYGKETQENCVINESTQIKLNSLFVQLTNAQKQNDSNMILKIRNSISELKKTIADNNEKCISEIPISSIVISNENAATRINSCIEYRKLEEQSLICKKRISDLLKNSTENIGRELQYGCNNINYFLSHSPISSMCDNSTSLGQTVSQAIKNNESGAIEIDEYYKQRLSEVMSLGNDTDTQIQNLRVLKDEIDNMITELINNQKQINTKDISDLVSTIKISKNEIDANNIKVKSSSNIFNLELNGKNASLRPTSKGAVIESDGVSAVSDELTYENGTLTVDGKAFDMLPKEVIEKLNLQNYTNIYLKDYNGKAAYEVNSLEKRKLFGFIPVNINNMITVDSMNASVVSQRTSWWSFMTNADEKNQK